MAGGAQTAEKAVRLALANSRSTVDADRSAAERTLDAFVRVPGYAHCLASVLASERDPIPLRQLAGLVLRRYIRRYWTDAEATNNALTDPERDAVRHLALSLLKESSSLLRRTGAMVVAEIATVDFPTAWPSMVSELLSAAGADDPILVQGAMQCLALAADDIFDPGNVAGLSPALFPRLMSLFLGAERPVPLRVRTRAAAVLGAALRVLARDDSEGGIEVTPIAGIPAPSGPRVRADELVAPMMAACGPALLAALATPPRTFTDATLQTHAVGVVSQIALHFPAALGAGGANGAFGALFRLLAALEPTYLRCAVHEQDWEGGSGPCVVAVPLPAEAAGGYDSEGDEELSGAAALASALLAFVEVGLETPSKQFHAAVSSSLGPTARVLIAYLPMTADEQATWEDDPNTYLLDDDDFALANTVRQVSQRIIALLVHRYRAAAVRAVGEASIARVRAAAEARARGDPEWWRAQEGALLAVGTLARHLRRVKGGGPFDTASLLHSLHGTAADASAHPFLRARALLCAASYVHEDTPADAAVAILEACVAALDSGVHQVLPLAAAKALHTVCGTVDAAAAAPCLPRALSGLLSLLAVTSGEVRYHVLVALHRLLKVSPEFTASTGAAVAPVLARLWTEHVSERVVLDMVLACLHALARVPSCLTMLQERMAPALAGVLADPAAAPSLGIVESAIDVARVLIARSDPERLPPSVMDVLLPRLFALLASAEESGILQSGSEALHSLVRVAPGQLSQWRCEQGSGPQLLLGFVSRALSMEFTDSAALFVGGVVLKIAVKARLSGSIPDDIISAMLRGVFQRMQRAALPTLQTSLLVVFCRLLVTRTAHILDLLASMPGEPPELPEEVKRQAEERAQRAIAPWYLSGSKPPVLVARDPGAADTHAWRPASGLEFFLPALLDASSVSLPPYHSAIVGAAIAAVLRQNDPRVQALVVPGRQVSLQQEPARARRPVTRSRAAATARLLTPAPLVLVSAAMMRFSAMVADAADEEDDESWAGDFGGLEGAMASAGEDQPMLLSDLVDGAAPEPLSLGVRAGMSRFGGDSDDDDDEEGEDDEVSRDAGEDPLMEDDVEGSLRALLMDMFKRHGEAFQSAFKQLNQLEQEEFRAAMQSTASGGQAGSA